MNKQLIVFYLKRHSIGIVGLVLAIGFGAAGFMMMGKAKAAVALPKPSRVELTVEPATLVSEFDPLAFPPLSKPTTASLHATVHYEGSPSRSFDLDPRTRFEVVPGDDAGDPLVNVDGLKVSVVSGAGTTGVATMRPRKRRRIIFKCWTRTTKKKEKNNFLFHHFVVICLFKEGDQAATRKPLPPCQFWHNPPPAWVDLAI